MIRALCDGSKIISSSRKTWIIHVRTRVTVPQAVQRRSRLKPKLHYDKFSMLSNQFLDRVQVAVAPLLPPVNEGLQVVRDNDVITIQTSKNAFEIKAMETKQQLHFTSPISGLRVYEWNARTTRWEDEADGHDLEGLLTRDLMRVYIGVPMF